VTKQEGEGERCYQSCAIAEISVWTCWSLFEWTL